MSRCGWLIPNFYKNIWIRVHTVSYYSQSRQNNVMKAVTSINQFLTDKMKPKLEYDIASDIRGLRESIQLTELKNFTITLNVSIVVDNHIWNTSLSNFIMFH